MGWKEEEMGTKWEGKKKKFMFFRKEQKKD